MSARRRLPVLTVVVALIAGLLAVVAPSPATAAASEISSGTVHWGVKESWRNYIGSGVIMTGGVTRAGDGAFDFPVTGGSFDGAGNALTLQLGGTVRFAAYCDDSVSHTGCLLDSTFSTLRVTIAPDRQELRGDYDGISRDTPGGAITHYEDVLIATINALGATPVVDGGTTTWPAMPTVAGDGFPLYPVGTTMDPVSLVYQGPGGAPDLGEHWSTPGAPAFTPGVTWAGAGDPARRDVLVGARWLHVVERATDAAAALTVRALDPETLAPGAAVEIPLATRAEYRVANDPASDRVFIATHVRTDAGGVRSGDVTITAVTWSDGSYVATTVGTIPDIAYTLNALTWNDVAGELAVITQRAGAGVDRFTLTRVAGGDAAPASVPIALPASATESQVGTTFFGSETDKGGGSLVALRDGSYLAVGALDQDGKPLPARHLVVGPQQAAASFVDGSVPTVQPFLADWNQYFTYERGTRASDGGVFLYSANWIGVVGYLDVVGGRATMLANDVPIGVAGFSEQAGSDAAHGLDYMLSQTAAAVDVLRDHRLLTSIPISGFARDSLSRDAFAVLRDGSLIAQVTDAGTGRRALQRLVLTGISPVVSADPEDRTVTLPAGTASAAVAFQSTGTGDVRWQLRPAGASTFTDIPGETSPLLALNATLNTDGTQVRAVFSNAAGTVASSAATIHVTTAPIIESQPTAPTVYAGQPYELSVLATGNPAPAVTWQRQTGDGWTDVTEGVDGTRLTVASAPPSDDGAVYRAMLSNSVDTVYSAEVRVTVRERPTVPETTTYADVALEWTGGPEWQHRPPNGSTANYFSAGVSDGAQGTYRAAADGVEILQRAADGTTTAATWETRGAHIGGGGQAAQLMRFTKGTAVLDASGSATITWPGAVSVNFYDGLVPFTLSNPTLRIAADGTGTLTADLSGYSGDMSNPDKPKEPVAPRSGVTVATFRGAVVDAQRGFVVTPDFAGVEVDARGGTPQVTSGSGWGAWPQPFVDFHTTTHLAAYFYSTGGSMDAAKRPAAFAVGFSGAGIPSTPVTPETPVVTPPVIAPVGPTTSVQTREGALLWGVKASFRSYITGPIAHGAIAVSGGASESDGQFRFGQTGSRLTDGRGTASYGGAVRFTGHSGVLDLTFADPQIRIDSPSSGALLVGVGGRRTELASLDLAAGSRSDSDGAVAYGSVPATLTASGAGLFSYGSSQFYSAGTAMDPVTFVIGADAAPGSGGQARTVAAASAKAAWTPPADPPTRIGLTIDPKYAAGVAAGSEIAASGAGFAPGETDIKVVVYSTPVVLEQSLTADEKGVAAWRGLLPATLAPGEHTLTFQGAAHALGAPITVLAAAPISGCTVTDASIDWGFKESFRSYISGSIAHGDWKASGGAAYKTPVFQGRGGTGTVDAAAMRGQVDFAGTITFSGHDGLLHTTVSDPRIRLVDANHAQLLLDVSGLTMDDALAGRTDKVVTVSAVPFVDLDLSRGQVSREGDTITAKAVPTTITADGFAAFPNYPAGTAFDPIDFSISVSDCSALALPGEAEPPSADAAAPVASAVPWWGWALIVGGALALAAAASLTTAAVMRGRRRDDEAPM